MIKIKEPIWKNRSVGIAESKMLDEVIEVEILYKDKTGNRLYPGIYKMNWAKAMTYPKQVIRGVNLRIIPIKDFEATGIKMRSKPSVEAYEQKQGCIKLR